MKPAYQQSSRTPANPTANTTPKVRERSDVANQKQSQSSDEIEEADWQARPLPKKPPASKKQPAPVLAPIKLRAVKGDFDDPAPIPITTKSSTDEYEMFQPGELEKILREKKPEKSKYVSKPSKKSKTVKGTKQLEILTYESIKKGNEIFDSLGYGEKVLKSRNNKHIVSNNSLPEPGLLFGGKYRDLPRPKNYREFLKLLFNNTKFSIVSGHVKETGGIYSPIARLDIINEKLAGEIPTNKASSLLRVAYGKGKYESLKFFVHGWESPYMGGFRGFSPEEQYLDDQIKIFEVIRQYRNSNKDSEENEYEAIRELLDEHYLDQYDDFVVNEARTYFFVIIHFPKVTGEQYQTALAKHKKNIEKLKKQAEKRIENPDITNRDDLLRLLVGNKELYDRYEKRGKHLRSIMGESKATKDIPTLINTANDEKNNEKLFIQLEGQDWYSLSKKQIEIYQSYIKENIGYFDKAVEFDFFSGKQISSAVPGQIGDTLVQVFLRGSKTAETFKKFDPTVITIYKMNKDENDKNDWKTEQMWVFGYELHQILNRLNIKKDKDSILNSAVETAAKFLPEFIENGIRNFINNYNVYDTIIKLFFREVDLPEEQIKMAASILNDIIIGKDLKGAFETQLTKLYPNLDKETINNIINDHIEEVRAEMVKLDVANTVYNLLRERSEQKIARSLGQLLTKLLPQGKIFGLFAKALGLGGLSEAADFIKEVYTELETRGGKLTTYKDTIIQAYYSKNNDKLKQKGAIAVESLLNEIAEAVILVIIKIGKSKVGNSKDKTGKVMEKMLNVINNTKIKFKKMFKKLDWRKRIPKFLTKKQKITSPNPSKEEHHEIIFDVKGLNNKESKDKTKSKKSKSKRSKSSKSKQEMATDTVKFSLNVSSPVKERLRKIYEDGEWNIGSTDTEDDSQIIDIENYRNDITKAAELPSNFKTVNGDKINLMDEVEIAITDQATGRISTTTERRATENAIIQAVAKIDGIFESILKAHVLVGTITPDSVLNKIWQIESKDPEKIPNCELRFSKGKKHRVLKVVYKNKHHPIEKFLTGDIKTNLGNKKVKFKNKIRIDKFKKMGKKQLFDKVHYDKSKNAIISSITNKEIEIEDIKAFLTELISFIKLAFNEFVDLESFYHSGANEKEAIDIFWYKNSKDYTTIDGHKPNTSTPANLAIGNMQANLIGNTNPYKFEVTGAKTVKEINDKGELVSKLVNPTTNQEKNTRRYSTALGNKQVKFKGRNLTKVDRSKVYEFEHLRDKDIFKGPDTKDNIFLTDGTTNNSFNKARTQKVFYRGNTTTLEDLVELKTKDSTEDSKLYVKVINDYEDDSIPGVGEVEKAATPADDGTEANPIKIRWFKLQKDYATINGVTMDKVPADGLKISYQNIEAHFAKPKEEFYNPKSFTDRNNWDILAKTPGSGGNPDDTKTKLNQILEAAKANGDNMPYSVIKDAKTLKAPVDYDKETLHIDHIVPFKIHAIDEKNLWPMQATMNKRDPTLRQFVAYKKFQSNMVSYESIRLGELKQSKTYHFEKVANKDFNSNNTTAQHPANEIGKMPSKQNIIVKI